MQEADRDKEKRRCQCGWPLSTNASDTHWQTRTDRWNQGDTVRDLTMRNALLFQSLASDFVMVCRSKARLQEFIDKASTSAENAIDEEHHAGLVEVAYANVRFAREIMSAVDKGEWNRHCMCA